MPEVEVDRDGAVLVVSINRPEVRNAIDGPTARALAATFRDFDADPGLSDPAGCCRQRAEQRGQRPAPHLVDQPARTAKRNLPVGDALEIATELSLDQFRLGDQGHRGGQLRVHQLGRLLCPLQWAVDDPADAAIP